MKAFITKYALSEGIQERDGQLAGTDGRYFANNDPCEFHNRFFFGPSDWTFDKAIAIQRAEAMRKKKIASLKQQIAKLEGMKFE